MWPFSQVGMPHSPPPSGQSPQRRSWVKLHEAMENRDIHRASHQQSGGIPCQQSQPPDLAAGTAETCPAGPTAREELLQKGKAPQDIGHLPQTTQQQSPSSNL